MRVLLVHSGSSFSTHDVYVGLLGGFKLAGHEVVPWRLDYHMTGAFDWVKFCLDRDGRPDDEVPPGDVLYQCAKGAAIKALETMPDAIVIVSGLRLEHRGYTILGRLGVPVVLFGTENPYDDDYYLSRAPLVDVMTCCDPVSVEPIQDACRAAGSDCKVVAMPLGYLPPVHFPGVGAEVPNAPAHDVVFVGTGFPERVRFLEQIDWTGIDLGLYGSWDQPDPGEPDRPALAEDSPLRPFLRDGVVGNVQTAAMYDRAKIVLNLFRTAAWRPEGIEERTNGTAISVRLIEAAAIGACVVSEWRPEVPLFGGNTIATFTTPAECGAAIRRLLADDAERAVMRAAIVDRAEGYSYVDRARQLIALIEEAQGIDKGAAVA
ncbi:MAG: hypothetical protein RL139_1515 [Gemmatimonadota bacterium]|jgi:hypothetical protein